MVTEGVFTRRVLDDPALDDVAALLFDEFHERSLDADLGLALARDVQTGLRNDLRILVMSATLDGARIARLMDDAPVIESSGRAFAVETRYVGRDPGAPIERQAVDTILQAIRAEAGSVLAFLPGAAEIRRAETQLRERIADPAIDVVALFGALEAQAQDRAIAPAPPGRRKIVLATSIAETSLTIEGVRVVVDCGLARVPRYEPDVGLTRLETVRVSRAAADQRRGRAGRTQPGVCYRLWDAPQTASLEPANRPEILAADLSGFALDLAHWGVRDSGMLDFIDPPPAPAMAEAKALLAELGAVDAQGHITQAGKSLRQLPLPPRLARMVVDAGAAGEAALAAEIAVVLTERGLGGNDVDLAHRLDGLARDRSQRAGEARSMAKRWAQMTRADGPQGEGRASSAGAMLALAYPDRIAKNRGRGEVFAGQRPRRPARCRLALGARALPGSSRDRRHRRAGAHRARRRPGAGRDRGRPGATHRDTRGDGFPCRNRQPVGTAAAPSRRADSGRAADDDRAGRGDGARLLAQGIVRLGVDRLPWTKALRQWRDRVMFLRDAKSLGSKSAPVDAAWPDLSDPALAGATGWLMPATTGKVALAQIAADDLAEALMALLPWNLKRELEVAAPTHFTAPTGSAVAIDYQAEGGPKLAIRVQELFGLDCHPTIAGGRALLVIEPGGVAGASASAGHARSAGLLARWQLLMRQSKPEMKGRYPAPSLGSDDPLAVSAHPFPRQAARAR